MGQQSRHRGRMNGLAGSSAAVAGPASRHARTALASSRSEGHFVIFPARFLRCLGLRLDLQLKRLDEADRRRNVVEDQKALFVVQDGVVVREALVVAHVVERFQHRDAGFQNALGHLRFKVATFTQRLDVLAEDAVQGLVAVHLDAVRLAGNADELDDECVQAIQRALGLVLLDGFADVLRDHLEVAVIGVGRQRVQLGHRLVGEQALRDHTASVDQLMAAVTQTALVDAVGDQAFQHAADCVVRRDGPEGAHPLRLGVAACAVLGRVDVDAVVDEEFAVGAVGKVQHVAAAHAKQLFQLAPLERGQVGRAQINGRHGSTF